LLMAPTIHEKCPLGAYFLSHLMTIATP